MASYDLGDPQTEGPHNLLSNRTVVYASGVIARKGDPVRHHVDPDELDLRKNLAHRARRMAKGIDMLSLGSD